MKKYIALEINIPDRYKEQEDVFMKFLMQKLNNKDIGVVIGIMEEFGSIEWISLRNIFTGRWEFTDLPKGS